MKNFRIGQGVLGFIGKEPTTLDEAWDITLEKWSIIVREWEDGRVVVEGPHTCGLCMMFRGQECEGCPISIENIYCADTPRDAFVQALHADDFSQARILEAAKAELAFLKGLRK